MTSERRRSVTAETRLENGTSLSGQGASWRTRQSLRVIVSVQDRNHPQAYAVFHGKRRVTAAGADAQIDKLAKRFLGIDKYPYRRPTEKRLIVRIEVDRISGMGPGYGNWS